MHAAKKLIEVALPLDAINRASAREKSIRHGHPSTLHLWWSRKPLASARAVIFTSIVDDPNDPNALPEFVNACNKLPAGPNVKREGDTPRMRLFDFIEQLVTWEATTNKAIMNTARQLIHIATKGNPPPLIEPFAGGGSIPLEAQRLGLEAHASDLNPVAVMINKAMIEIPPRFADMPPVNPRDRKDLFPPHPPAPSPTRGEGEQTPDKWDVSSELRRAMTAVARGLRGEPTEAEERLWQAIRRKQISGRKFRRQMPIGAFVVDFYCPSDRLVVEVDGGIHDHQLEADQARQELIESLGIRFLRLTNDEVMSDLPGALGKIEHALSPHPQTTSRHLYGGHPIKGEGASTGERAGNSPSPLVGEGAGGWGAQWRGAAGLAADVRYYGEWMRERAYERIGHLYPKHNGETVIAWLWARTVLSPNPAVNAPVPLVSSFVLSKKRGRECWAKPVVDGTTVRFEVTEGLPPEGQEGTMIRRKGARCIISGAPMTFDYIKKEGKAGRMGAQLMAIVTAGKRGRSYYSPDAEHVRIAESAKPEWEPHGSLESRYTQAILVPAYGLTKFSDLFTPRQLTALTTFSDLVHEARELSTQDAMTAGLAGDEVPLREGGRGARAYGEAVSVYLAFAVDRAADFSSSLCIWDSRGNVQKTFGRQALPMVWDYAETNVFGSKGIPWDGHLFWICKCMMAFPFDALQAVALQADAQNELIPPPPPARNNIISRNVA